MNRLLVFHPLARLELQGHARYLATVNPALAAAWLETADRELAMTLDHPLIGPVYWRDFRKLFARRFKLLILYRIIPGGIGVGAIVDARVDPKRVRRILRSR